MLNDIKWHKIHGLSETVNNGSAVKIGGKINQITPEYAPPDQLENLINGKGADPKMDIFALGIKLKYCWAVTGLI
jgi:hypothetical protein